MGRRRRERRTTVAEGQTGTHCHGRAAEVDRGTSSRRAEDGGSRRYPGTDVHPFSDRSNVAAEPDNQHKCCLLQLPSTRPHYAQLPEEESEAGGRNIGNVAGRRTDDENETSSES